eukprot:scaffold64865_cov33-Tisochrysis_lutea.AAC.2
MPSLRKRDGAELVFVWASAMSSIPVVIVIAIVHITRVIVEWLMTCVCATWGAETHNGSSYPVVDS